MMYDSDCAQVNYPMCTLANTPRKPEHCVEYVRQQEWAQEAPFGGAPLDTDSLEHIEWIRERADRRARRFGIAGPGARGEITLQFTQGVVKHIIPTVASTNAVVAAICALEVFKLISGCVVRTRVRCSVRAQDVRVQYSRPLRLTFCFFSICRLLCCRCASMRTF